MASLETGSRSSTESFTSSDTDGADSAKTSAKTGAKTGASVLAVVPTVGASPVLENCLRALKEQRLSSGRLIIALVDQGPKPVELPSGLVDLPLRPERNLGFTGGTNLGIAAARSRWVATVNDDFVADDGWLLRLQEALEAQPKAAAAQGINRSAQQPQLLDGVGLGFNRWLQAVQLGHGEPVLHARSADMHNDDGGGNGESSPPREVFGVSATAALYRRSALEEVALEEIALGGGASATKQIFDEALGSYYEDADLALRLRGAGWLSLWVPAAGGAHQGALSTTSHPPRRLRWLYRNRLLVVARLLGRALPAALPTLATRDGLDLTRALIAGRWRDAGAMLQGWGAALKALPRYAHRRRAAIPRSDLRHTHHPPWT
ncbi:MAG: glycosyltransferase [Acidobacteriota bacterium]